MNAIDNKIRIEKIDIKIHGLSPEIARDSVVGFDRELLSSIGTALRSSNDKTNEIKTDQLNTGTIYVEKNIVPSQLRKSIINSIVRSIVPENL